MSYSKGDRVVYTGAGVWSASSNAIGQLGTVKYSRLNTTEVEWDEKDRTKAPPLGVFNDNLAAAFTPALPQAAQDVVSKPSHYTSHPSGVECIEIVKHMSFTLGNVIKYVWRADLKGKALEDLRKAREYIDIEIATRQGAARG